MQRMNDLDVLVRHVLPQVLPCPKSMVLDALQAISVDFCRQSEVWSEQIQELGVPGDSAISLALPSALKLFECGQLGSTGLNMMDGGQKARQCCWALRLLVTAQ